MLIIDINSDGIGYARNTFALRVVASVGQIVKLVSAAIIACDDDGGIIDIAFGAIVIHVLRFADACFHVRVADRGFDYIERRHLMVVDIDVFLAGRQKNDTQTE